MVGIFLLLKFWFKAWWPRTSNSFYLELALDPSNHLRTFNGGNVCLQPNCFSKVIEVSGTKHIMIFALRTISRGEELTYDYKFPFEEVKIKCTCGAKRCRGFLN